MLKSVLKALPGKLDIKIISPSILCILTTHAPIGANSCTLWLDPPISTVTLISSHYEPGHVISNNVAF